jgi:hypothetical protein
MENSNKKLLFIIGGIVLFACACIAVVGGVGSGLFLWNVASPATSAIEPVVTVLPEFQPSAIPETDENPLQPTLPSQNPGEVGTQAPLETSPAASSELPSDVASQMDDIQQQVIALRGLQTNGPVDRDLLTPEQLREHVLNNFLKDYTPEEARDDVIFLSQMGFIEPDFDLEKFFVELYSEQVAGYYDDETKKMYVVKGEGFEGPERLTYAHEYIHALQDQNYNFKNGLNFSDEACDKDTERCTALQALIEGDASVSEFEWFSEYSTQADLLQIQKFYSNYKSPIFDSAPSFMQEDFIFPYTYGQSFVENLRARGDWEAVDQAFKAPPLSTEQILHPDRYPDDQPVTVEIPDFAPALGAGWREVDRDSLGEWYTFLLLAHGLEEKYRLEDKKAQSAAQGWGGDKYVVYHNDDTGESVLVLDTQWDSVTEAGEFADAFREYGDNRFGARSIDEAARTTWENPETASEFRVDGQHTTWVLAPDAELLGNVSAVLQQQ